MCVSEEDWEAVQQLLGGVVRRPAAAGAWGEREARVRINEVARAIGALQDVVWQGIQEWKAKSVNFPPPVDIVAEPPVQSFSAPAAPTRSAGHVRVPRGSEALPERRD